MAGSEWQRQALAAVRAGAAAQQQARAPAPTVQTARERAVAQDVSDMLAAVDPVPAQQQRPVQQQPAPPEVQGVPAAGPAGQPVVSGVLTTDVPEAAPVVGTGGMPTGKKILVAALILIFVLGAGAAGYFIFTKDEQQTNNASQQEQRSSAGEAESGSVSLRSTQAARNTGRLADVSSLLVGAATFSVNNNGKMPTGYSAGNLVGDVGDTPLVLSLEYYQTIQVKSGEQAPLTTDELWLVTGVQCDPDTGGTIVGTSRAMAVLYGRENSAGGFDGACEDA